MIDVGNKINKLIILFLNTGSPASLMVVTDLENYNVKQNGANTLWHSLYGKEGSNINFVKQIDENPLH
jgi:diaminopimelate epimerase